MNCFTNIIQLTLVLTCLLSVNCQMEIERDYDIKLERIELDDSGDEWLQDRKIRLNKYNQTNAAINGTVTLVKDLPLLAMIQILGYEKNGNTYSDSAGVNITRTVCDYMLTDALIYPDLIKFSNFPTKCPVLKGHFFVQNFILKDELFPVRIPGDDWLLHVIVYNDPDSMTKLFGSKWYLHIDRTRAIKNKKKPKGGPVMPKGFPGMPGAPEPEPEAAEDVDTDAGDVAPEEVPDAPESANQEVPPAAPEEAAPEEAAPPVPEEAAPPPAVPPPSASRGGSRKGGPPSKKGGKPSKNRKGR